MQILSIQNNFNLGKDLLVLQLEIPIRLALLKKISKALKTLLNSVKIKMNQNLKSNK